MARTIQEIRAEINRAKNNDPTLSTLNSNSQTALWRLWIDLVAFVQNQLEQLFDIFKAEINDTIEQSRTGKLSWYVAKAKAFQNGDTLNGLGEYDVEDASKQIVTRASAVETSLGVSVKVAKGEPPMQLSSAELASFVDYINKVKFAGVGLIVINLPAEVILVNIEIFYSEVSETAAKDAAKLAIQEYIKSIAFDGQLVFNDLIARCREKQGVVDVLINSITANGVPITGGRYTAGSGYFSFDSEAAGNNYTMTNL